LSSVQTRISKETLIQSGGNRRISRLWNGIASPSRQNEVITAGRWRDEVIDRPLESLLGRFCRTGLIELYTIQGFIVPRIEELAGVGALRDGTGTLSKLGLVKANQAALAKMLQLVQVDTRIPREYEG
jgi:hypothetical protein